MKLKEWIDSAKTDYSYEEVMDGVERGDFFMFLHEKGVMIGEFVVSPRHQTFNVWIAGGSLEAIEALTPQIEEFARENGCDSGRGTGRKGWERYLSRFGYKTYTIVEKAL